MCRPMEGVCGHHYHHEQEGEGGEHKTCWTIDAPPTHIFLSYGIFRHYRRHLDERTKGQSLPSILDEIGFQMFALSREAKCHRKENLSFGVRQIQDQMWASRCYLYVILDKLLKFHEFHFLHLQSKSKQQDPIHHMYQGLTEKGSAHIV